MKSSALEARSQRQREVRAEILEAAAEAIARHGYHGMSMRGLARATGRGLASFYNYFSSKEDLLFALQAHAFETLNAALIQALAGVTGAPDRLYIFILNHLRYVADHRAVMRVLVHEAAALPPARRKAVRTLKERYFRTGYEVVKALFREGRGKPGPFGSGRPDPLEVERATYSIFGMLNWSFGWYEPERHGSLRDVAGTIHRIALCGAVGRCPEPLVHSGLERHLAALAAPPLIGTTGDLKETRKF